MSGILMAASGGGPAAYIASTLFEVTGEELFPGTAAAGISFESDGWISLETTEGIFNPEERWLVQGTAADFECYFTISSGTLTSGTTGSWVAVSGSPTWRKTRTAAGSSSCIGTIQIRRISDGLVLDTVSVDLTAIITP